MLMLMVCVGAMVVVVFGGLSRVHHSMGFSVSRAFTVSMEEKDRPPSRIPISQYLKKQICGCVRI